MARFSLIISLFCMIILLGACGKTKFEGDSISPKREADGSPGGEQIPAPTPGFQQETCVNQHKALRIGFVVDNSGSNSRSPGEVQTGTLEGTDPIRIDTAGRRYTDRQQALYEAVNHVVQLDAAARANTPSFQGSQMGLAFFPRENTNACDGNFQLVSGSHPAFPQVMTESRAILDTPEVRQQIWNSLDFTHNPKGITPYLSAVEAAKRLLIDTRKPGDTRQEVVMLITDGIPTDDELQRVRTSGQDLAGIEVILLSIYEPKLSTDEQNRPAKDALRTAWDDNGWGKKEYSRFEDYWQALIKLPSEIVSREIRVNRSSALKSTLDDAILTTLECSP